MQLDGTPMMGTILKIGRPKSYIPPGSTQLSAVAAQQFQLMQMQMAQLAGGGGMNTAAMAAMLGNPMGCMMMQPGAVGAPPAAMTAAMASMAMPATAPTAPLGPPTRCLRLSNMITAEDIEAVRSPPISFVASPLCRVVPRT